MLACIGSFHLGSTFFLYVKHLGKACFFVGWETKWCATAATTVKHSPAKCGGQGLLPVLSYHDGWLADIVVSLGRRGDSAKIAANSEAALLRADSGFSSFCRQALIGDTLTSKRLNKDAVGGFPESA